MAQSVKHAGKSACNYSLRRMRFNFDSYQRYSHHFYSQQQIRYIQRTRSISSVKSSSFDSSSPSSPSSSSSHPPSFSPSSSSSSSSFSTAKKEKKGKEKDFDTVSLLQGLLPPEAAKQNVTKYKTDTQLLARWLDVSIVGKNGKAFKAMSSLAAQQHSVPFPPIDCFPLQSLLDNQKTLITFPRDLSASAQGPKIVVFSFKQYGFTLLRNWITACLPAGGSNSSAVAVPPIFDRNSTVPPIYEVCFIEFSFLSMAKGMFAKNISTTIHPHQFQKTFLKFGGVSDFAGALLLPNVYTGYVFLLDIENRVRWVSSGEALKEDLLLLKSAVRQLEEEGQLRRSASGGK